jgi:serine/threonine-protein kinase RsbW
MPCHSHEPCTVVRLPFDPSSVSVARKMVARDLEAARIAQDKIYDAKVLVSELITNGVLHGKPVPTDHIELCWLLTEAELRVSVRDGGKARELEARNADPDAVHGRGLAIVDYMCTSWQVCEDDGTRLIAELAV